MRCPDFTVSTDESVLTMKVSLFQVPIRGHHVPAHVHNVCTCSHITNFVNTGMEEGRMESCPRKQEMGWTIKHTVFIVYMYMTRKVSHWTSYFMGDKATVVAFN